MRRGSLTKLLTKAIGNLSSRNRRKSNTGGGNRTHTGLPPEDFKSSASAIPPRRQDSDSKRTRESSSRDTRRDLGSEAARQGAEHSAGCRDISTKTEGVGFEPTVGFHLLRFSRPSQSTTLAPLLLRRNLRPTEMHPASSRRRKLTYYWPLASSRMSSATKIGTSTVTASAIASLGRESTSTSSPS